MTTPPRDTRHEETLAEQAIARLEGRMAPVSRPVSHNDVRLVIAGYLTLRAEVERLRAKAAIVDAMERGEIRVLAVAMSNANWCIWRGKGTQSRPHWGKTLLAAYAAATGEGTE